MSDYLYDVFVSHASEDKSSFVDALVTQLECAGLRVWYDAGALAPGDRLNDNVRRGIERSRFGVVAVSEHFMRKEWTKLEVDILLQRPERVVPIWHGVAAETVRAFNPVLADSVALRSEDGVHAVALALLKRMAIHHEPKVSVIEHYHGSVRVSPSSTPDHYLEILEVGGVYRVPRGQRLLYHDMITTSSPLGSIDLFQTVPPPVPQPLPGQRFQYFDLIGPEHASVMPICGRMHATKKFSTDDGYVAVRLPYFTRFVTLTFDYTGLAFELPEVGARIHRDSVALEAGSGSMTLTHWRDSRVFVLQGRDLSAGSNPMICWGHWLTRLPAG
jgi:hypothetical protein